MGVVGTIDDEPGDTVVDRLRRATRLAGHLWHPARRGFDEHDAEALLLQPSPPGAAGHREHVPAAVQRGQAVVGDPPEEADRSVALGGEAAQSPLVAAAAGDRQYEVGSPRRQQGDRFDGDVEALAWDEPRDRHDQLAVGRQTELTAGGEPVVGFERDEPVGVDTRRHDGHGQLVLGGTLRLFGGVPAGGDDMAGSAQNVAERLARTRKAPRHGHLGPVQHDVVRQLQGRSDQSERQRRVEDDEVGTDVAGRGRRSA